MSPSRRLINPRNPRYGLFHCPREHGARLFVIPAPNSGLGVIAGAEMYPQHRTLVLNITSIVSTKFEFFCRT